jgi:hypothetical protein
VPRARARKTVPPAAAPAIVVVDEWGGGVGAGSDEDGDGDARSVVEVIVSRVDGVV